MSIPASRIREVLAASRLERFSYAIRDVVVWAEELAGQGHEILPLNIGDPLKFDFSTPPHMIEAVERAMRDGKNGYAPSLGLPEAIDAVRRDAERKGIRNIQSAFITEGVSEAVDLCLAALINPGEMVLSPEPDYSLYGAVAAKLGAQPNSYRLDESNEWQPDLAHLESRVFAGTRAIVVINPNNPTGAVYSERTLLAIAEIARQNGLVIIADEIYDRLVLDGGRHISIAALAPDIPVVTLGGLSKAYLCPGWRIGWGVLSGDAAAVKPYVEAIHKLLRARLSACLPMQYAIPAAVDGSQDHLIEVRRKLSARRDLTMDWARRTPHVSCVRPKGAFYAFPRLEIEESDEEFVRNLLREKHVLVVHGSGFGQAPGTRHFRVVFLPDEATLQRAYASITEFVRERYGGGTL